MNTLPVETVDPRDISNAALFLASDEARYSWPGFTVDIGHTTSAVIRPSGSGNRGRNDGGTVTLPIDAGLLIK